MEAWAKFPTKPIIEEKSLKYLIWKRHKSDGTAALLVLIALAVKRNLDGKKKQPASSSVVTATYDDIQALVAISRSKVSKGLALLAELKSIERLKDDRSSYRLVGLDTKGGWAQLPQNRLMQHTGSPSDRICAFEPFYLRAKSELDALKVYLLMIAFRDWRTGYAHIGYGKIMDYTGIAQRDIKKAKSHLISLGLIYAEHDQEGETTKQSLRYKVIGLPMKGNQ